MKNMTYLLLLSLSIPLGHAEKIRGCDPNEIARHTKAKDKVLREYREATISHKASMDNLMSEITRLVSNGDHNKVCRLYSRFSNVYLDIFYSTDSLANNLSMIKKERIETRFESPNVIMLSETENPLTKLKKEGVDKLWKICKQDDAQKRNSIKEWYNITYDIYNETADFLQNREHPYFSQLIKNSRLYRRYKSTCQAYFKELENRPTSCKSIGMLNNETANNSSITK